MKIIKNILMAVVFVSIILGINSQAIARDSYPGLLIKHIDEVDFSQLSQYVKDNSAFVFVHPSWNLFFSRTQWGYDSSSGRIDGILADLDDFDSSKDCNLVDTQIRISLDPNRPQPLNNKAYGLHLAFQSYAEFSALQYLKNNGRLTIIVLPNYNSYLSNRY